MRNSTRILSHLPKTLIALIVMISACGRVPQPPVDAEVVYVRLEVITPADSPATEPPVTEPPETEPPVPVAGPAAAEPLKVTVTPQIAECGCNRNVLRVDINLEVENGEPPYMVNGESPVTRDNIIFRAEPGVTLPITVKDKNGLSWQGEVVAPNWCPTPTISCTGTAGNSSVGNGPADNENDGTGQCTEVEECTEEEVCTDVEVCTDIEVCVDWAGSSGNCKSWETETICEMEEDCEMQEDCTTVCR